MSSGVEYPMPTYIPPLSVFNPLFFPQSFGTTTTSGGGGGFTNIFPNGLTSGNVITMDGGTGGGGGTGVERTITGISYLDFVDSADTNPTNITGYITLNGNTLEIGSNTALSGINVNLLGTTVSANGVSIATGGNVSNDINNTFQAPATTQTFNNQEVVIDNSVLSFPNGGNILMGNGTATIQFPNLLPATPSSDSGLAIGWNQQASVGEIDMICYGQGGIGGFAFYSMTNTTTPTLITQLYPNGISFFKNIISNNTFTGTNAFQTPVSTLNQVSNPIFQSNYSSFYSLGGLPYFAYNNGGTYTYQQLTLQNNLISYAPLASPTLTGIPSAPTATAGTNTTQLATTAFVQSAISGGTNILGTYTSSGYSTFWAFSTIPNTLGNQFSFIIYSNTAKVNTQSPLLVGDILQPNMISDYILAVGTAILVPYKYSNNVPPTPTIYNTSGYIFTAPTAVGGLTFSSQAISQSSTGTTYVINATSTASNPITNGSTLTLVAYNSYF